MWTFIFLSLRSWFLIVLLCWASVLSFVYIVPLLCYPGTSYLSSFSWFPLTRIKAQPLSWTTEPIKNNVTWRSWFWTSLVQMEYIEHSLGIFWVFPFLGLIVLSSQTEIPLGSYASSFAYHLCLTWFFFTEAPPHLVWPTYLTRPLVLSHCYLTLCMFVLLQLQCELLFGFSLYLKTWAQMFNKHVLLD